MSALESSSPVQLSFKVNPIKRWVTPKSGPPHYKTTKCDWGKIFEERLSQQYPDMEITRRVEDGKEVFIISFVGRPTRKGDVKVRVYDFLRNNPSMKIHDLHLA